jgi:Zn-dependent M16 (insulinase) family peptidase
MMPGWLYQDDPFRTLGYQKPLSKLTSALSSRYLEDILQQKILNNPHALLALAKPKKGLAEKIRQQSKDKLAKIKASLSDEKIETLVNQTNALKKYQATPDTPEAIATVPMLKLSDMDPKEKELVAQAKTIAGIKTLFSKEQTNHIVYLDLFLDSSQVPQNLIPYVALLSHVLGELDTKNYSYADLDAETNIHTGGIDYAIRTLYKKPRYQSMQPKFVITARALTPKTAKLFTLIKEITTQTRFDDSKRLKQIIDKLHARLQSNAERNGIGLAITRLSSYFSAHGKYKELTSGLSYYKFIDDLAAHYEKKHKQISANLKKVAKIIFNRHNLMAGITGTGKEYKEVVKNLPNLAKSFNQEKQKGKPYTFTYSTKNEGLQSTSKVQYVLQGHNFRESGHEYTSKLSVLSQILSRDFLYNRIRVQNGAYGAGMQTSRSGQTIFYSYRDPHLNQTFDSYAGVVKYLQDFKISDREMTRYIIGTIANRDKPLTVASKGRAAIDLHLRNISQADLQKERDDILSTKPADIRAMANLIADVLKKNTYCVYGNEKKLSDNKKLFNRLVKVIE